MKSKKVFSCLQVFLLNRAYILNGLKRKGEMCRILLKEVTNFLIRNVVELADVSIIVIRKKLISTAFNFLVWKSISIAVLPSDTYIKYR